MHIGQFGADAVWPTCNEEFTVPRMYFNKWRVTKKKYALILYVHLRILLNISRELTAEMSGSISSLTSFAFQYSRRQLTYSFYKTALALGTRLLTRISALRLSTLNNQVQCAADFNNGTIDAKRNNFQSEPASILHLWLPHPLERAPCLESL